MPVAFPTGAAAVVDLRRPLDAPTPGVFPPGDAATRRSTWESLMRIALNEAKLATRHDDVPIGAVVVGPTGELLGAGHNRREELGDPVAHAEILALQQAAYRLNLDRLEPSPFDRQPTTNAKPDWRLTGCTVIVTLEPCVMCVGAIIAARAARIVFGAWDPKSGACGSVWDLARDAAALHQVEVVPGILAPDSEALLKEFFQPKR